MPPDGAKSSQRMYFYTIEEIEAIRTECGLDHIRNNELQRLLEPLALDFKAGLHEKELGKDFSTKSRMWCALYNSISHTIDFIEKIDDTFKTAKGRQALSNNLEKARAIVFKIYKSEFNPDIALLCHKLCDVSNNEFEILDAFLSNTTLIQCALRGSSIPSKHKCSIILENLNLLLTSVKNIREEFDKRNKKKGHNWSNQSMNIFLHKLEKIYTDLSKKRGTAFYNQIKGEAGGTLMKFYQACLFPLGIKMSGHAILKTYKRLKKLAKTSAITTSVM